MPVYNEADILEQTITHMITQGIPLIIVDNESNDGSLEIEQKFIGKGVLEIRILRPDPYYRLKAVLKEGYASALEYSPDWILHTDADEFPESPYSDLTLVEAIENEARLGYNLIQFDCFDFLLTEKDYRSDIQDVKKRLRYYTWTSDFCFKAWKHYLGTDLVAYGGHKPVFPKGIEQKVSPIRFVMRHYRFRSLEHGIRKVFKERLPRYDPEEVAIGWHVHYNNLKPDASYFVVDSLKLRRYEEDGRWDLERKFDPYFGAWVPPGVEDHLPAKERIAVLSRRIEELSKKLDESSAREKVSHDQLQQQFDAIYRSPPVRVYLALKKLLRLWRVESKQLRSRFWIAIRIDDVYDFHHEISLRSLLDHLVKKNIRATLGVVSDCIGKDSDTIDLVRKGVERDLFEIASHSTVHDNLTPLSYDEQLERLSRSKERLESLFSTDVVSFIPPFHAFDLHTLRALTEAGYKVFSAGIESDPPPWVRSTLKHYPATIQTAPIEQDYWKLAETAVVSENVQESIKKYGFAVLLIHPQQLTKVMNGKYLSQLDQERFHRLVSLLDEAKRTATIVRIRDLGSSTLSRTNY